MFLNVYFEIRNTTYLSHNWDFKNKVLSAIIIHYFLFFFFTAQKCLQNYKHENGLYALIFNELL